MRPDPIRLATAQRWFGRYGWPSLFFAWLPVIGDPLTLAAGMLREPLGPFLLLVGFAKTARYVVLATAFLAAAGRA